MSKGDDDGFPALKTVTGGASVTDVEVVSNKHADLERLRSRVLVLRDEMGEAYFEMGRLLYRINRDGLYANWRGPDGRPYQTFEDYVEYEVTFKFRKARYLMSIWWWFAEELGDLVVMEKVKQIGWTKAAMLVGVVDAENVDVWVAKANALKTRDLAHVTRVALEAADQERPDRRGGNAARVALPLPMPEFQAPKATTTSQVSTPQPPERVTGVRPLTRDEEEQHRTGFTVLLDGVQRRNVDHAIDLASKVATTASDGKGYLLDLIATSFLSMYAGTVGNNDREHKINFRNEFLRCAERALGVDLIAIDRGSNEPLFGIQTIERLAKTGERDAG